MRRKKKKVVCLQCRKNLGISQHPKSTIQAPFCSADCILAWKSAQEEKHVDIDICLHEGCISTENSHLAGVGCPSNKELKLIKAADHDPELQAEASRLIASYAEKIRIAKWRQCVEIGSALRSMRHDKSRKSVSLEEFMLNYYRKRRR